MARAKEQGVLSRPALQSGACGGDASARGRGRSRQRWRGQLRAAGAGFSRARARVRAGGARRACVRLRGACCPRAGSERGQHRSGCQRLAEVSAGRACRRRRLGGRGAALSGRSLLGTAGPGSRAQGSFGRLSLLGGAPHLGELPRPGPRPPRLLGCSRPTLEARGQGTRESGTLGRAPVRLASQAPGAVSLAAGRRAVGGVCGLVVTVAEENLGTVSARWWTRSRPRGTHIPGRKGPVIPWVGECFLGKDGGQDGPEEGNGMGDLARGRRKLPRFKASELIRGPSEPAKHFKENIRWRSVERMMSAASTDGCIRWQGLILNGVGFIFHTASLWEKRLLFLGKATAKEDIAQPFVFGGSTSGICSLHPENICVLALGVPGRCRGEGGVSAL